MQLEKAADRFWLFKNEKRGVSGFCEINLLGAAMAPVLLQLIWNKRGNSPQVESFSALRDTWIAKIPLAGNILAEQNVLFYLSILLVILGWMFLFKTTKGMRMRMVSENPQAANTVAIRVTGYKYFGVIMSGFFCGLGGAYLSLGQLDRYVDGMTAGRGYIAIVINVFGHFNPLGALGGSLFFGFFDSLQTIFQGGAIPSQIIMMMPYILTLLVITFGLKGARAPAGVGKDHIIQ